MGFRAHAFTKYDVEFGISGVFNNDVEELEHIIGTYCPDAYFGGDYGNDDWEIDKEDFRNMIDTIKKEGEDAFIEKCGEPSNGYTFEQVVKSLEILYEDGMKTGDNYGYIRIACF